MQTWIRKGPPQIFSVPLEERDVHSVKKNTMRRTICMNVKDINTRRSIVKNYCRFFICFRIEHSTLDYRPKAFRCG